MSDALMSPLFNEDISSSGLAVTVEERTGMAMIDLRLQTEDQEAVGKLVYALGMPLPTQPRTSTSNDEITCLWMSIDQWLIIAPLERRDSLIMSLETTLEGSHYAVTDVSDARGVLRITGEKSRQVLMKSISNDVFSDEVVPGFVRRATVGEIATAIHFVSDEPEETFDIYMFRSFAPYALDWIKTVANEKAILSSFFEKTEAPDV